MKHEVRFTVAYPLQMRAKSNGQCILYQRVLLHSYSSPSCLYILLWRCIIIQNYGMQNDDSLQLTARRGEELMLWIVTHQSFCKLEISTKALEIFSSLCTPNNSVRTQCFNSFGLMLELSVSFHPWFLKSIKLSCAFIWRNKTPEGKENSQPCSSCTICVRTLHNNQLIQILFTAISNFTSADDSQLSLVRVEKICSTFEGFIKDKRTQHHSDVLLRLFWISIALLNSSPVIVPKVYLSGAKLMLALLVSDHSNFH